MVDISEIFDNFKEMMNNAFEKIKEVVSDIEFRELGASSFVFFICALIIHIIDVIFGFNRASFGRVIFALYFFFAAMFFFSTLPGEIKIGNLFLVLLLTLWSYYAPLLFIIISKQLPWMVLMLVFTPVWPIFILYKYGSESTILQTAGFVIEIFWVILFLSYIYTHIPHEGKNIFYERAINVKVPAMVIIKSAYNTIKEGSLAFVNDLKIATSTSFNNFLDRMISIAMGESPDVKTTKKVSEERKIGIEITNFYSVLDEYFKDIPVQVFFSVKSYELADPVHTTLECVAISDKTTKKGKIRWIGKSSDFLENQEVVFQYNQVEDFECKIENLDEGSYNVFVILKIEETASSSLLTYLIDMSTFAEIRKKGTDFFTANGITKPQSQQNGSTALLLAIDFSSQPLLQDTPNKFIIDIRKFWSTPGEIQSLKELKIDFKDLPIREIRRISKDEEIIKNTIIEKEEGKNVYIIKNPLIKLVPVIKFFVNLGDAAQPIISTEVVASLTYILQINSSININVLNITTT